MATVTILAAMLTVPVAGCGGDDSTIQSVSTTTPTDTTSSTVATDEFITAADARCAEANAAVANLSTDAAASATTIQQQLNITKQTLAGLKALGEPEDPDGSLADYYAAMEDQISVLKQQQSALTSGDTAAADALDTQLSQAESDAETAATAFGLEECGQQGSTLPSGTTTSAAPTTTSVAPATTTTPAPVTPAPTAPPATGGTGGTGGSPPPPSTGGGTNSGGIAP